LIDHKASSKQAPSRNHDQKRSGVLDVSAMDWLQGLGILDREGKLRASMADKHRQINHYLEIFSHLAAECGWNEADAAGASAALQMVDMGCGKGYLTFGLWHLFQRVWKRPVKVI